MNRLRKKPEQNILMRLSLKMDYANNASAIRISMYKKFKLKKHTKSTGTLMKQVVDEKNVNAEIS